MSLIDKANALLKAGHMRATGQQKMDWKKGTVLELYLPVGWPNGNSNIKWCLRSSGKLIDSGQTESLDKFREIASQYRVLVWPPQEDILLTKAQVPSRNRRKILRALPYTLEDSLISDPAEEHYVYLREDNNELAVAVTKKEKIESWLSTLKEHGLSPNGFFPPSLGLEYDEHRWVVYVSGESMTLRCGKHCGGTCSLSDNTPPLFLRSALLEARARQKGPDSITIYNQGDDSRFEDWDQALDLKVDIRPANGFDVLDAENCDINLLQDAYAPPKQKHSVSVHYYPAMIMFGIWLLGTVVATIIEWNTLRTTYNETKSEMVRLFKNTFPEIKAVLDPAAQMQTQLNQLKSASGGFSDNDLLSLLYACTPALKATEGHTITNVKYSENSLVLGVRVGNYQSLESLKDRLSASRLKVEVLSANTEKDNVVSRLKISSVGGS